MSDPKPNPSRPLAGLLKQRSWSPDSDRDETWLRRKGLHRGQRCRLSRSVTDEDLDELRGCIDLGFGFDAESESGKRLAETLPALDLYYAVRKSYHSSIAEGNSPPFDSPSSSIDGSPMRSGSLSIFSPGDSPEMMKARLKQWAQVVACSLRQRW